MPRNMPVKSDLAPTRHVSLSREAELAIHEVIRDVLEQLVPQLLAGRHGASREPRHPDDFLPDRHARTADIRGVMVHTDGAPAVTFCRRQGQCPNCNKRLGLNAKIIGLARVDSPDLLVWVCAACANKLRRL